MQGGRKKNAIFFLSSVLFVYICIRKSYPNKQSDAGYGNLNGCQLITRKWGNSSNFLDFKQIYSLYRFTKIYCMANDFYKNLHCSKKNIWLKTRIPVIVTNLIVWVTLIPWTDIIFCKSFLLFLFSLFLYAIMLNHTFLRANEHVKLLSHLEAALFWFQEALCYLAMESVGVEPPACYGTEQGGKAASGAEGRWAVAISAKRYLKPQRRKTRLSACCKVH